MNEIAPLDRTSWTAWF